MVLHFSGKLLLFFGFLCALSEITTGQDSITTPSPTPIPTNQTEIIKVNQTEINTTIANQTGGVIKPKALYFVISAKNLPGKDTNKKLDPFVKVYLGTGDIKTIVAKLPPGLKKLDRSEVLKTNIHPEWYRVFQVQWTEGKNQKIYLEIRDHDLMQVDDIVGYAAFDLDDYVRSDQEIVTNIHMASRYPFYASNGKPEISIRKTETFSFTLAAKNLPRRDEFNSKSDPFVECFFRSGREGKDLKFHTTPIINNEDSPTWTAPVRFSHYQSSNDQWFYFKIMDHDAVTPNDLLGDLLTPVNPFVNSTIPKTFLLDDIDQSFLTVTVLDFVS